MRIPFDFAQVWFASMYFEPSTMYTRCLFRQCRQAWLDRKEPRVFSEDVHSNVEIQREYTEHYKRHGPYSLGLVPFFKQDEEIIEV